ncbi:MAG: ABC transporter ATP-binding protein [Bacteroidales bacterium]|jgi:ABC-type multidrug transport system fused ATPase/permease subunit|nr:ABC transporter ATP-binding protein [Bacteroidales bacterium]MDD4257340.1 ABC transporter ATP-binding protein [Bacteroidales bacterium]MDD4655335.1 ABC transporter ATP-binding protein [Bacteroidales bacterium]MDD4828369.1 ABC transporter ATP-binding protein [Bacteroidales bacterium]HPS24650.1 ABC transporter ATP-binding protein [Bacteroidales bacterium]
MKRISLVLLTISAVLLELAGLALVVPLLLLLLEEGGISGNEYLNRFYTLLNVSDYGTFLLIVCGLVVLFTVVKNYLLYMIGIYKNRSLLAVYTRYSGLLFKYYYDKGLLFIKESRASVLSHNTNAVCYAYVFNVLSPALTITGEILLSVLILGVLACMNVYVAITEILLFVPLVILYQMKVGGKLQKAGREDNEAKRNQWRITMETFRGYAEVAVNNAFPGMYALFGDGLKTIADSRIRTDRIKSAASGMIEIGVMVVITGVIAASFYLYDGKGNLLVEVGLFALATLKLLPAAKSVVSNYAVIRANRYTKDVINEISVKKIRSEKNRQTEVRSVDGPLPFDKTFSFRNVSFGYGDRAQIIRDLSFTIRKGEKIGIKGISGIGKSTLFYLMLGLCDPASGEIFIDNTRLSPQNRARWHKRAGYVSQDIFIMDATLAQNIVLAQEVDEQRLFMAIERASLKGLVESLPLGVQSRIGDAGCLLSGGEKQRVAIARALYKDADVFFLDEPTSSLDKNTEKEVAATIMNPDFYKQNVTVIIISHDDNLLSICDRVITLG